MTLKMARKAKGLTQKQLAQQAEVSTITISAYEQGTRRPAPSVANKIAQILDLSFEQIWEVFYADEEV